jgi:MFS transporter, FHS family, L-fucose permease
LQQMKMSGQLNAYLQSEANTVKIPALIMACVILVVWLLFYFTKFPEVREPDADAEPDKFSASVLRHSHLRWAVIAQFFYVGAQVGVGSFFVRFSKYVIDMPEKETAFRWGYIAMAGFMVGRFTGTFFMRYIQPAKLLSIYAVINIALLAIAVTTKGNLAVYAVMASPFFMSIMFPTIFALGIKELGEETKLAAAFLVMSIIGGGLAPIAMGFISDRTGSMQIAYVVPLFCFFFVLYYGLKGYKIKTLPDLRN